MASVQDLLGGDFRAGQTISVELTDNTQIEDVVIRGVTVLGLAVISPIDEKRRQVSFYLWESVRWLGAIEGGTGE